MKHWLFRFYGWVALIGFGALIALGAVVDPPPDLAVTIAGVTGLLSFVHFVQQQKLEETRLFRELFKEFNERYDEMNERLNALRRRSEGSITPAERDLLYDYFNLCAEEYLFYRLGYIVPEAWKAWERGMGYYLEAPQIAEVWRKERESGSYYGLEAVLNPPLGFITEGPGSRRE